MIKLLVRLFSKSGKAFGTHSVQSIVLFVAVLLYSATGYMYFELPENPDLSWGDAFWWSIVTMTTVGYGDYFPSSVGGRFLVGVPTMMIGIGILGYFLSLFATAMIESKLREARGLKPMNLNNHIIICNYISIEKTQKLVRELRRDPSTAHVPVVLIDETLDELPAELREEDVRFVKGNPSREPVLTQAGVETAWAVIAQADASSPAESDNLNLRTILTIENMAAHVISTVECVNPENEVFFRRAQCDNVVCIASLTEQILVQELQDPGVSHIIAELTSNTAGHQIYLVDVPEAAETYQGALDEFHQAAVAVLGIRRGKENHLVPPPDFPLRKGDKIIMIAAERPS